MQLCLRAQHKPTNMRKYKIPNATRTIPQKSTFLLDRGFAFAASTCKQPPLSSSLKHGTPPSVQDPLPASPPHATCTPLCSTAASPGQGLGAGSKSRKQNTVLQGLLNLCSHNIWIISESFTSIHARCSALFVASWEAQKTIAGGGRSIPIPCPSLSLHCHN